MDTVERLDLLAIGTVRCWAATCRRLWERACEHDGVDPAASFVSFSKKNPFVPYLESAQRQYHEAVNANRQVGYVGLEIHDGQARIPDNVVREGQRLLREEQKAMKQAESQAEKERGRAMKSKGGAQPAPVAADETLIAVCRAKQKALLRLMRAGWALMEEEFRGDVRESVVQDLLSSMEAMQAALIQWQAATPLVSSDELTDAAA